MLLGRVTTAVVLSGVLAVGSAGAESGDLASSCPRYTAHLRSARAYLERGDRTGAQAELQRAQQALQECMRGQAGETGLAARTLRPTRAT